MGTWDIRVKRNLIDLVYHTAEGRTDPSEFKAHTLEEVVGWVAGQMGPGDWATVNGAIVLQRFRRQPVAIV